MTTTKDMSTQATMEYLENAGITKGVWGLATYLTRHGFTSLAEISDAIAERLAADAARAARVPAAPPKVTPPAPRAPRGVSQEDWAADNDNY